MNASLNRWSAKIYQFPVGGRSATGRTPLRGDREAPPILLRRASARLRCGGAWYHDAAIQDAKPVRER
jgi:hypothetical protein